MRVEKYFIALSGYEDSKCGIYEPLTFARFGEDNQLYCWDRRPDCSTKFPTKEEAERVMKTLKLDLISQLQGREMYVTECHIY